MVHNSPARFNVARVHPSSCSKIKRLLHGGIDGVRTRAVVGTGTTRGREATSGTQSGGSEHRTAHRTKVTPSSACQEWLCRRSAPKDDMVSGAAQSRGREDEGILGEAQE